VKQIQDPAVQKNAIKLVEMIKKSNQRGTLPVVISSVLLKFARASISERASDRLAL